MNSKINKLKLKLLKISNYNNNSQNLIKKNNKLKI